MGGPLLAWLVSAMRGMASGRGEQSRLKHYCLKMVSLIEALGIIPLCIFYHSSFVVKSRLLPMGRGPRGMHLLQLVAACSGLSSLFPP
jgi:hypothetical protein